MHLFMSQITGMKIDPFSLKMVYQENFVWKVNQEHSVIHMQSSKFTYKALVGFGMNLLEPHR